MLILANAAAVTEQVARLAGWAFGLLGVSLLVVGVVRLRRWANNSG